MSEIQTLLNRQKKGPVGKKSKIKYTRLYFKPWKLLIGGRPSRYRLDEIAVYKSNITGYNVLNQFYRLDPLGRIFAYPGLEWDGATLGLDTKDFMRGSLFHDIGVWMINRKELPVKLQPKIDKMLLDIIREDGMPAARACLVYKAVRTYQRLRKGV